MIRFISFFIFLLIAVGGMSQDVFNEENSVRFADFLFRNRMYKSASEEFLRAYNLNNENDSAAIMFIKSCRLAGQTENGLSGIRNIYGESKALFPASISDEYVKLNLLKRNFSVIRSDVDSLNFSTEERKQLYKEGITILVNGSCDGIESVSFVEICNLKANEQRKSPFVAGFSSAVIPGAGKVYCGQWKDGLISLAIVSANVWQSYRGFKKDGIKSPYGWIFGAVALGFYSGNIWGSAKAAININKRRDLEFENEVVDILYNN